MLLSNLQTTTQRRVPSSELADAARAKAAIGVERDRLYGEHGSASCSRQEGIDPQHGRTGMVRLGDRTQSKGVNGAGAESAADGRATILEVAEFVPLGDAGTVLDPAINDAGGDFSHSNRHDHHAADRRFVRLDVDDCPRGDVG